MQHTVPRAAFLAGLALALAAACAPPSASAVSVSGLYEGVVAGEGGESGRAAAAADALRQVVVRVTGQRGAATEAALAPVYADARRYVQTFRSAPGGQVAVGFDPAAVDAALLRAGARLWPAERPLTVVFVAGGARELTGQPAPELRQELERAAQLRGLPLAFAGGFDPALTQAALADGLSGRLDGLRELARRVSADGVLLGRPGSGGLLWSWLGPAGSGSVSGPAAEAVQTLADRYGAQFAMAAATPGRLTVVIAGVRDLAGYAAAITALSSIGRVDAVDLEEVSGDTLRLRVAYGSDAASLQQAATQAGRLLPFVPAAPDGAVHFVLQP